MSDRSLEMGGLEPTVLIRPARVSDAEDIARVHVETWRDAYAGILPDHYLIERMSVRGHAARWRNQLARDRSRSRVFVAESLAGAVLAYAVAGPARLADHGEAEIYELYVATDYQGRGFGRRLCGVAARDQQLRGLRSICVEVLADNPARFFYEALGGRRVATRRIRFAGRDLPASIYAWPDISRFALAR